MKIKYLLPGCVFLFALLNAKILAQDDIQIGKSLKENSRYNGALYDYSDANGINIKVMVWGYVQFPGQYIIPVSCSINDFLSLAGGPSHDADIDNLRLFRINPDSNQTIIKFNYSDLLWNNSDLSKNIQIPRLHAGDILLVPGSPKWFLQEYLSLTLSIVATIASVATLLVYLYKK
jgi:hypothetical protein